MEPVVGIDLGTTNSEIAFIINEHAEILKDNDNGIVPSCVGIDRDGKIIVGTEARNQASIAPERTILSIKREMGTDKSFTMGDSSYKPQEISAFILKALKSRAEKVLGMPVSKAVITVPAYFTDAQRHATREAGEIAGLNVVRIINEPTAAALAYESERSETQRILIFDLGGGTFDVSIVKIEQGIVEVLASTGDNHLGGDDFDMKIVEVLAEHCEQELKISVKDSPVIMARLKRAAENAKIMISSQPYAVIEEDHIGKKMWKDVHLSYELSRIDFEEMIEDDLSRTMESVNKALKDANILPSAIDKIILVGGSTRIPKISNMLEKKFGSLPHSEIDPDLCVALGAAIQAGREMGLDSSSILLDITPYTFGTSAVGDLDGMPVMDKFIPMIRRNTKLPTSKTDAFYTMFDNQEAVEIDVFQGEAPIAPDNIRIGNYKFKLTKAPAGSVILLNFDLDVNGILKIEATEKKTGRKINAVIENAFSGFSDEELSKSQKRINDMWGDDEHPEEDAGTGLAAAKPGTSQDNTARMPQDIEDIIKQAESMLQKASDEDKDEIINLIEDMKDAITENKLDTARELKKELEDILFYIE
ncbi:Putative chaperone protein, DnaK-like [Desulfonema limicola]|uniref:Chaperone protein, DnaK-like n=1 Tax=Desulfonema limicola TaxID=45656 RepID=A0A975GI14_9BACT|nr:Hsp70 family protein [Desulfonema limicola]QTA82140.1 Putative chaperone protein, DnaK-like [Desulfonema limicola]